MTEYQVVSNSRISINSSPHILPLFFFLSRKITLHYLLLKKVQIFQKFKNLDTKKADANASTLSVKLFYFLIEVYSLDVTLVVVSAAFNSVVLLTVLKSHLTTVSSYSLTSVHLTSTWSTTV